ncbi:hypothetical protein H0O03_02650, partial [Candidatus Micrarchaeota archaeon]|nr:hypothetical protein [Candidatus Micrarchaeota archaeon]
LFDSLPFALYGDGGKRISLKPARVKVFPWAAKYFYEAGEGELCVEYYLFSAAPRTLGVFFSLTGSGRRSVLVKPLVDLRHMYADSVPEAHSSFEENNCLVAEKEGCRIVFSSPSVLRAAASSNVREWFYKLGDGSRRVDGGALRFAGSARRVFAAGEIELDLESGCATLFASASNSSPKKKRAASFEVASADERRELLRLGRYAKAFEPKFAAAEARWGHGAAVALEGRFLCLLDKFEWGDAGFPDAGAFWFRNAWFRDAFEGINTNFSLYFACRKRALRNMILDALALEKNGLIPNKFSERSGEAAAYNSLDATLLAYLAALKFLHLGRDREVLESLRKHARSTISSFAKGSANVFLDEKGLLRCPANFGWIDSMRRLRVGSEQAMVPSRVPEECVSRASAEFGGNAQKVYAALNAPAYYLVECNALWLAFLKELLNFASDDDLPQVAEIVERVEANYKEFFMLPNGFLSHCVCSGSKPVEESSAALVAMALLPDSFSGGEVKKALDVASEKLFVRRGDKLFGVLCRNSRQRTFFGDEEYHGAVVWPRDSPYLLSLLERVDEKQLAEQLVLSALEHQQSEAAVFFNSELFSLAEGPNPSPGAESAFPVPVKNPGQYWSQWTQPMFEFIDKKRS